MGEQAITTVTSPESQTTNNAADGGEENPDGGPKEMLPLATFKPFTKMSYQRLVEREQHLKERAAEKAKYAHEAHLVDGELKFGMDDDEEELPPENADLREGCLLTKAYGRFPLRLLGKPIEEIDPGIQDKTFVVISRRFSKRYINRFSATKSLFLLTPWNGLRRLGLYVATNQIFDMFIFLTIITNCVFLAMPTLSIAEQVEYLFLAIYTLECIVKVISRGFCLNKHTYLRDPWNWLDFVVILTAFLTILVQVADPSVTVGNLQGLRTFRVLRALKTVSIVPGLKTIVNALLRAFKMLFEVILLTMFCLMVFAMFGLQVYMGVLRQKCVAHVTGYVTNPSQSYDHYYAEWIRNSDNWYLSDDEYVICGNNSGSGTCPDNYTCLGDVGDNPRYGYLNFDHFGWALLTCFQLITLDFWEDIYGKVIRATGPWNVIYFIIVIFFGSFYLINLMLAVVSMSYEEEAADSLLDPEIGALEGQVIDRNCDCCQRFCCCYISLLKMQNVFYTFVQDPLFDLVITICIVLNTVFLSLEHHNQDSGLTLALNISNYIFTSVFIIEAVCKIIGLGKYYFMSGWNIFDLIIVIASVLDMGLEQVDGLSVLRTFRLLRVFKLAQSWATMRLLLTIILSTLGALGNLCIILGIVIYIFAVIGLQLFREDYIDANFGDDGTPRWNFKDFYRSMLMIFRVLCGEWIEASYQCMRASNELCMVVFLPALVFGNFIVLNLFLALLLNAFASDSLDKQRESSVERSKFLQGFDRLRQLCCCCCPRPNGKVEPTTDANQNASEGQEMTDKYNESDCGQCWHKFRCAVKKVVDHKIFESIVLLVILGSSLTLAFEDIYLYQKPTMEEALKYCNIIFAALFALEMVLKIIGLGATEYFTSFWTLLDFFIVCISLLSLIGDSIGLNNITAFRSLRTLRALRPLRAISRWQGMKIVVNALMNAIPAIVNVLMVCMVFWLIFSIMGVQFFAGKFYKCVNVTTGERISHVITPNRNACDSTSGTEWENSNVNFDNSIAGFLALFQVATFEGWMEIMSDAADTTDVDQQPIQENSSLSYLYFVVFIVFGAFFSLNLFIGVIIDNFNVLKKKYEGSYLDAFLTQSQRNYYNTLKKLGKKKPQKTIKRPKNRFQLFFYELAMSSKFELAVVLLIFFNMIVMAIEHYKEPDSVKEGLEMMNIIFTTVFTLEAVVKLIGLRLHYFRFLWNIFDFIIVIISILGIILSDVLSGIFVTPTLLRIIRVFRIGRVLRLIKAAKGIRKLLFALIISLPAIFNIGALLFLVMYMYAIIGMSSFGNVKINGVFDEVVNFQTFGNSFMLLLRLATAAGWNDVLEALLIKTPYCNPDYYTQPDGVLVASSSGDCGIPYLAIPFMVTYIIIVWLIVINMYIAIILENFNQAHEQEELGITEDDFDMFYVVWEKYDPHATQFIKYEQLADFVGELDQPLQIPKPNEIALVSFNLPIMEGEKIHCLDILIALVRNVLADVEETEELKTLKEQMEAKFAQNFPSRVNITVKSSTLQRKKEDVAARTLQRAWRSFKAQKAMRNITALAVQQKLRRASAVGLRTRSDVMRNLGNRLSNALNQFFSSRKIATPSPFSSTTNLQETKLSKQPKIGQHLKVPQVFTLYPGDKSQNQTLDL
ncbi:sodium channel protein 1 brain [Aplysia californica]|uniref:Sodium channel protein n=1 Tax=Aplysia californica TaxID=6500 RepID=A0ABM1W512_APLCA|nr:sodium channel protein 1 brain [Aplysia californica]